MLRIKAVLLLLTVLIFANTARAENPQVRAVFFYSPTCPHCHEVIDKVLPPLLEKYGERLVIVGVNVLNPEGGSLFQTVMDHFGIPRDDWGVPAMVVGERLLKGGREIPDQLDGLVARGLEQGGIPWPDYAGLRAVMTTKELAARAQAGQGGGFERNQSLAETIARDPLGNGLAILVLAGMLLSLAVITRQWVNDETSDKWPGWVIPLSTVLGLLVAGYLSYVEVGNVEAVCGPVGDCNTVQQSPYSRLFGLIPAALLGLAGYLAIGAIWLGREFGPARFRDTANLAIWTLALTGTLFSVYFTFLEPFVIGATCIWCLSSAVLMTVLLWSSNGAAQKAWRRYERTG